MPMHVEKLETSGIRNTTKKGGQLSVVTPSTFSVLIMAYDMTYASLEVRSPRLGYRKGDPLELVTTMSVYNVRKLG